MSPSADSSGLTRRVVGLIRRYQESGGARRWFGVECNFEPSCSGYGIDAIQRFGLLRGLTLAWRRIRRCRQRDTICKCLEPVPETWKDAKASRS